MTWRKSECSCATATTTKQTNTERATLRYFRAISFSLRLCPLSAVMLDGVFVLCGTSTKRPKLKRFFMSAQPKSSPLTIFITRSHKQHTLTFSCYNYVLVWNWTYHRRRHRHQAASTLLPAPLRSLSYSIVLPCCSVTSHIKPHIYTAHAFAVVRRFWKTKKKHFQNDLNHKMYYSLERCSSRARPSTLLRKFI